MKSNAEWQHWGRVDPLWAVNSRPGKQAGSAEAWTDEEFLASGRLYFEDVARQWQQYGMGTRRCIEIGCGAGRITHQLAERFDEVVAIDVSPHQIEKARRLLGAAAAKVTFHLVREPAVPVAPDSCDGMFCTEVFQHLSSYHMVARYLEAVFAALAPGATICFQLPVIGVHRRSPWRSAFKTSTVSIARALGRRRIMEYRAYPVPTVFATLEQAGFAECEMRVFEAHAHPDRHAYFFARKPAGAAPRVTA
jgi:SAM-dependent methyltransferase